MSKRTVWSAEERYLPKFGRPITGWWRVFAWRPIWTVDRGWVWLRVVHRRRIHLLDYLDDGPRWWFQHAIDI
ncbi:hypothetical protein SEA_ZARTROSA_69 [Arthrobacter phage Zartrosa]|uniref:Uncharacterized protein n=1 Tax=Arthrobacter phage Zartrosa TaxID=2603257 RepID=A0A5B8WG34_9CAUD|nr:hypothetical protein HYP98_gp69 [Arthrobacter phage Zartrosa]QED11181.1 hypothetical protein SEA_ZARTROSA_69 [Arthrobacter phage Zartrosa]